MRRDIYMYVHWSGHWYCASKSCVFQESAYKVLLYVQQLYTLLFEQFIETPSYTLFSLITVKKDVSYINTFTAKIDHSRFNNLCLRLPASTLVNLIFQSRCFCLGGKIVQQLQYI
jgi:hypothetical protein